MAVYFLEKSKAYREQTKESIFRRRQVVAAHLNGMYKAGKDKDETVFKAVTDELLAEGISVTFSAYQADKAILRYAFRFLTAGSEQERKTAKETAPPPSRVGINCLVKDGITSWSQLGYADPGVTAQPAAAPPAAPPPQTPRFRLSAHQAGVKALERWELLQEAIEEMLGESVALRAEIERLTRDNAELQARLADNSTYIDLAESELAEAERKNLELREAVRRAQTVAHAAALETIAQEHPELPELTVIVQKLRQQQHKPGKREELLAQLPTSFVWANDQGNISYREAFLCALAVLGCEDQARVIEQLKTFAREGAQYASLYTQKYNQSLPFTPQKSWGSRITDELRFTWAKKGPITVYWLYRKGDTRVRQSEQ